MDTDEYLRILKDPWSRPYPPRWVKLLLAGMAAAGVLLTLLSIDAGPLLLFLTLMAILMIPVFRHAVRLRGRSMT